MPTRSYRMTERARSVAETRTAVIEAASELLSGPRFADVSMGEIAAAAGVSRGTIYNQFGSRGGLIEEVTTAAEQRAGFDRVLAAARRPDPVAGLAETLSGIVRFYCDAGPLFANLRVMARTDAATRRMVVRKERARRDLIRRLVTAVDADGRLAPGLPVAQAVGLLVGATNAEAVGELVAAAGSPSAAASAVEWLARGLVRGDA